MKESSNSTALPSSWCAAVQTKRKYQQQLVEEMQSVILWSGHVWILGEAAKQLWYIRSVACSARAGRPNINTDCQKVNQKHGQSSSLHTHAKSLMGFLLRGGGSDMRTLLPWPYIKRWP